MMAAVKHREIYGVTPDTNGPWQAILTRDWYGAREMRMIWPTERIIPAQGKEMQGEVIHMRGGGTEGKAHHLRGIDGNDEIH